VPDRLAGVIERELQVFACTRHDSRHCLYQLDLTLIPDGDRTSALLAPDRARWPMYERARVAVGSWRRRGQPRGPRAEREHLGSRLPTAPWTDARPCFRRRARASEHTLHSATSGFRPSAFRIRNQIEIEPRRGFALV